MVFHNISQLNLSLLIIVLTLPSLYVVFMNVRAGNPAYVTY